VFRKDYIALLLDRPMTISEIARRNLESPKDVADDLAHLLQSLKHTEFKAVIAPALCRKCGFEFRSDKLSKPSKCPECHGTWLQEARIEIRRQGSEREESQ
jgi:transcriptional regulator